MKTLKSELLKHGFRSSGRSKDEKKTKAKYELGERMTDRDFKELMGQYRPTYRRGKGGAFRQR